MWVWNMLVAIGTILLAVTAIFGERLKSLLFRPRLHIFLCDPKGDLTTAQFADGRSIKIRYYHIGVENRARHRWPPATSVRLVVQRIDLAGPDGSWYVAWSGGPYPLIPKYAAIAPDTVGPPAFFDFFSISENPELVLRTVNYPNNMPYSHKTQVKLAVTLQALSVEADSEQKRFEIYWDGKWHIGADEMASHLVVKQ